MVFMSVQYLHNVRIINTVMVFMSVQYLHNVRMVMIKRITCHDITPDYFLASYSQKQFHRGPAGPSHSLLQALKKARWQTQVKLHTTQNLTQFSHSITHHKNKLYQSRPSYTHIYDSGNWKTPRPTIVGL